MYKKYKNQIIIVVFSVLVLLGLVDIVFDIANHLNNIPQEYIVAFIGFLGAILGGLITLFGVKMTISANEKSKAREELPGKLHRLEKAKKFIDAIIEDDLAYYMSKDRRPGREYFLSLDRNFEHHYTDAFKRFTDDLMQIIREDLVFVDSEAYNIYSDVQEKLNMIELDDYRQFKLEIAGFQEEMFMKYVGELPSYSFTFRHELNDQEQARFNVLKGELSRVDGLIATNIEGCYRDLQYRIHNKHEELKKDLDY